jgi:hypothetical protein
LPAEHRHQDQHLAACNIARTGDTVEPRLGFEFGRDDQVARPICAARRQAQRFKPAAGGIDHMASSYGVQLAVGVLQCHLNDIGLDAQLYHACVPAKRQLGHTAIGATWHRGPGQNGAQAFLGPRNRRRASATREPRQAEALKRSQGAWPHEHKPRPRALWTAHLDA